MFYNCGQFKGEGLENWNVSNVENMNNMFCGCEKFDCDLSGWDVSNVENMNNMFAECHNFDCDLSNWNVSKVNHMEDMFYGCKSLKNKPNWYK